MIRTRTLNFTFQAKVHRNSGSSIASLNSACTYTESNDKDLWFEYIRVRLQSSTVEVVGIVYVLRA